MDFERTKLSATFTKARIHDWLCGAIAQRNLEQYTVTQAVCFKCGEIKFGAFCPCPKCHAMPGNEDDLVISMAMTDHYFDLATLRQMGDVVRKTGKPPKLDPESEKGFRETIRGAGDILSQLGDKDGPRAALQQATKPWWKFW